MIGKTLATLRKQKKISQEKLAKELNVSRSTVAMWENNSNEPDINTLVKIANLFKISLDELACNEKDDFLLFENNSKVLNVAAPNPLLKEFEIDNDEYITDHENKLIDAYRAKPELQLAVDIILGITDNYEDT